MKTVRTLLFALAVTTAGLIHAADKPASTSSSPQTQSESAPVVGGAVLGVNVEEIGVVASGYRVSKLLGAQVQNDKKEKIGKIEEFILKPDGTLSYAIIDVGGFLKIGGHRVAIPVNQFSAVKPNPVLPGATKEALKAMPEFQYTRNV